MHFHQFTGYRNPENAFLGATIGRVANRIAKGKFNLTSNGQQKVFNLDKNDGQNTLHGGFNSFGRVMDLLNIKFIESFNIIKYI